MAKQKRYKGKYLRTSFTYMGKKYYIYGVTQQELIEKEMAKRQELENGQEDLYNPTISAYYEDFTSIRRKEIKESTLRSQRCQFENIANVKMNNNTRFGDMRIKDITRRDIEKARQILLDEGKTPQNLNNCFAHLNHVFSNAVLDDTINKNPCKALKQLKREIPPISENKHRALSIEETQKFFEAAATRKSYYYNGFEFMLKTGVRIGELAALYITDIDKSRGFIHIRRTIVRDENGGYCVGDNAKTNSGKRDIPLMPDVLAIIQRQQALNRVVFGFKADGLLFKSAEGSILREYGANREIKRICKEAGIDPFTCHAFRNTFATRFIEQQPQDYKILSEILGHKDVAITLNLYTHVMTENKVRAMEELNIKIG